MNVVLIILSVAAGIFVGVSKGLLAGICVAALLIMVVAIGEEFL